MLWNWHLIFQWKNNLSNQQRFIFVNKQLKNNSTLSNFNFRKKNMLHSTCMFEVKFQCVSLTRFLILSFSSRDLMKIWYFFNARWIILSINILCFANNNYDTTSQFKTMFKININIFYFSWKKKTQMKKLSNQHFKMLWNVFMNINQQTQLNHVK